MILGHTVYCKNNKTQKICSSLLKSCLKLQPDYVSFESQIDESLNESIEDNLNRNNSF